MKNGKKILLILLSAILCLGTLLMAGCGGNEQPDDEEEVSPFAVYWNGTVIELGENADAALSRLGTPISQNNAGDCGGFGAVVRYEFSSFYMYVLENDEGSTVDEIAFRDDLVETAAGVTIGSSESTVTEKYGNPSDTEGKWRYYREKGGHRQIGFEIEDGKVVSVDLIWISE